MAFIRSGSAPADLAGPGKVGSAQDRTPGAHTGGCGEALLSGEGGGWVTCVCVQYVSIAVPCVSKRPLC